MATGGIDVSKLIECSICFEVYRDPHSLQCLHTFCKGCIDQLENHGEVPCPECREVCSISKVRKDFKTQSLIDSHTGKPDKVHGQTYSHTSLPDEVPCQKAALCGMCEEPGSPVVSHCGSCDTLMCAKCQRIHAKMKATKFHPVRSLTECQAQPYIDAIELLKSRKKNVDTSSVNIISALSTIEQDNKDKIKQVDQHIEKIRASIHKNLNTTYTNAKDILTETKVFEEENSRDIQAQINFLTDITDGNDLSTLQAMESELKGILNTDKDMSRRKLFLVTSPVTLQLRKVEPETIVKVALAKEIVSLKHMQSAPVPAQVERTENHMQSALVPAQVERTENQTEAQGFLKIATEKYNKVGSVSTGNYVHRMRMINGQLYCAVGCSCIHIYDTELKLIKKITSDKLRDVTSVAQCEQTGDLIVACGGSGGQALHQLTPEGDYVTCLTAYGVFSDVCCNSRKVYALEYQQCKIRVFEKCTGNVWSETVSERIQLKYSDGSNLDKILVTEESVFVSTWKNDCVCVYSLSSRQCLGHLQRWGQSGRLSHPRICDIDTYGSIMVCDTGNNKVQVFEGDRGGEGRWSCLTLPGLGGYPEDAVVGREGDTLWVATHNPHKVIKYQI